MHTWYVMPRKPRFSHPVRQVRTCLGLSQTDFAKLIGCSTVAVQRIENGSLRLSPQRAITILEATGADPVSLLEGPDALALDTRGLPYTKEAHTFSQKVPGYDGKEMRQLLLKLFHQLQLLLVASNRGGRLKTYVVNSTLQNALKNLADDFDLTKIIHRILIEGGHSEKRIYCVGDLRKFSDYARILGFTDNERYAPRDLKEFTLSRGWITGYYLIEKPILPPGADMKLRDAKYILDSERFIPSEIAEALRETIYWEIIEFRANLASKPVR